MKIELGKKYRTRDGREVRIYSVTAGGDYPVHAAVKTNGNWVIASLTDDGKNIPKKESGIDLIEVKENHIGYVSFFEDGSTLLSNSSLNAVKECFWLQDEEGRPKRIACARIEYEEGQFDE